MAGGNSAQKTWVAQVLGVAFEGIAAGGGRQEAAGVRLAKGVLLWNETRRFVTGQIGALQQAIVKDMADDPELDDIMANLANLDVVLEHLDDRLTDKLGEMQSAGDPSAKARLTDQARTIIKDMQAYVSSDELMADIDDNGFIPTAIKPRVEQTLSAILYSL